MSDNKYIVKSAGDGTYDVVQEDTRMIIARGAGPVTAQRVVNTINACPVITPLSPPTFLFQDLTPECGAPTGTHNFFMVRPKGIHPASGKKYVPTPVQMIDGELYSSDNELKSLTWSLNGEILQGPTNDPYQANLEWCPVPD